MKKRKIYHCHFCGEGDISLLYSRGDSKICNKCMNIINEIIVEKIEQHERKYESVENQKY